MMNQLVVQKHRIHRVGSITLGFILIAFGILFLLHLAFPVISYQFILHMWPVILISLGVEVLAANLWNSDEMMYDKGAVFLLIIMTFFTLCVGAMEAMLSLPWNIKF